MSLFTSYLLLLKKYTNPRDRVSLNVLSMVATSKSKSPTDLFEIKRAIVSLEDSAEYKDSIEVLKEDLLKKNRSIFEPLFNTTIEESIISPIVYFFDLVDKETYFKRNSILFSKEACVKRDALFNEIFKVREDTTIESPQFMSSDDSFEVEPLSKRIKSTNLIDELYCGIQCIHCGLRFKEGEVAYVQHIDSHARLLRTEERNERQVFPPENKWHRMKNIVEVPLIKSRDSKMYSEKKSVLCEVCKERLEAEWDTDKDCWVIYNGISIEGFTSHRECIE